MDRALASPQVQALVQELQRRGYLRESGGEQLLAYEKGQQVLFPFNQETGSSSPGDPPLPEKPGLDTASLPARNPGHKIPGQRSAAAAYVVFTLYADGAEEAFAVLRLADPTTVLHLYPDGERTWHVRDGTGVMEQLRRNERYRKFESWLRQGRAREVAVGPVLVDGTTRTAYVFVSGLGSSVDVTAGRPYLPQVYPPLDTEVARYLVLARATSWAGGVTLDPESLWVLPRERLNTVPAGDPVQGALEVVPVGEGSLYTVIAGGKKPEGWADLRNFAFFSALSDGDNRLDGDNHLTRGFGPANVSAAGGQTAWALTVFGWDLADYPDENVLLQFKTDAELTLLAYSAAVRAGIPVGLAVEERGSPPAHLIGFSQLTLPEVESLYPQALMPRDSRYVTAPVEGVIAALEEMMGVTFVDVVLALHELAQAEREGRPERYAELIRTPALQALVRLLLMVEKGIPVHEELFYVPRIRTYLRALALKVAQEVPLDRPSHLTPAGVKPIIVGWAAGEALNLLLNWVWDYWRGHPQPRFVRLIVDLRTGEVRVDIDDPFVQGWNWLVVWNRIPDRLGPYGVPEGLQENIIRAVYSGLGADIVMYWTDRNKFGDFERRWLAAAHALYYSYLAFIRELGYASEDNLRSDSPVAPAFRHMLALVHMAVTKALRKIDPRLKGRETVDNRDFLFRSVAWSGKTEATFVLVRKAKDPLFYNHDRVDHVVARYLGRDEGKALLASDSCIEQEVEHMRIALDRLRGYTNTYTPLPAGLNIAAVILPTLAGEELDRVGEFVARLAVALPYEEGRRQHGLAEHVAEAAFVIWKEHRGGKLTVVFRCIQRRGAYLRERYETLTKEEQFEIVRALLLPWERDLDIVDADEKTSTSRGRPSEPAVAVGVGSWYGDPSGSNIFLLQRN